MAKIKDQNGHTKKKQKKHGNIESHTLSVATRGGRRLYRIVGHWPQAPRQKDLLLSALNSANVKVPLMDDNYASSAITDEQDVK